MPLYYFAVLNSDRHDDPDGTELPDACGCLRARCRVNFWLTGILRRSPRPDRSHRRLDLLRGPICATINAGAMPILWRAS